MPASRHTIRIATRGSALALAQSNMVLAQCRAAFPEMQFELAIIKTTGDKLQTASLAQESKNLPKGLFTKELELALLERKADFAVHSLKDLPTDLPDGLRLAAVSKREDVRDVLIYRGIIDSTEPGTNQQISSDVNGNPRRAFQPGIALPDLPPDAVVATSSTRRKAQVLLHNPRLKVTEIRGNVATRLKKLAVQPELDATLLALAGLTRLKYRITPQGTLEGDGLPEGLLSTILDTNVMLPCVGQGAIGIESREDDKLIASICERLNDVSTLRCVTAERSFLAAMGGGCQSPVAAYGQVTDEYLHLQALSFANGPVRRAEATRPLSEAVELGRQLAIELKT
jgi:hydroxymethylbilane synthase